MTIYLIGVHHDYQYYWTDVAILSSRESEPHLYYKEALRKALLDLIRLNRIIAAREEAGSTGAIPHLIEAGTLRATVFQTVVTEKGIPHEFLPDLTDEDVGQLGLPSFRNKDLTPEQERIKREERERRWVEALKGLGGQLHPDDHILVVCGSQHLTGLSRRLKPHFTVRSRDTLQEFAFEPKV